MEKKKKNKNKEVEERRPTDGVETKQRERLCVLLRRHLDSPDLQGVSPPSFLGSIKY